MKSIKKCKIIKSHVEAAKYSGEDVWLIPIDLETMKPLKDKKPYVGDDWSIYNAGIYGYADELCWIAVEK